MGEVINSISFLGEDNLYLVITNMHLVNYALIQIKLREDVLDDLLINVTSFCEQYGI